MQSVNNLAFGVKEPICHTNIKFSPHSDKVLAVSSAANFGIVGTGRAQVKIIEDFKLKTVAVLEQKDAVFDISWCEFSDQFLLVGCGNGHVIFWNIQKGKVWTLQTNNQIQSLQFAYKNPLFLATNMNGSLRMGNADQGKFLFLIPAHKGSCYQAQWHPTSEKVFASGGGDGFLKLWDHTLPKQNIASFRAHQAGQIMSIDFNKYEQIIATASTDKTVKLWDLRNFSKPVNILGGHRYPIRKVRFSPHIPTILATGSYDMNVNIYDIKDVVEPLKIKHAQHTQFVTGVDFNMFNQKIIGTTGWDGRVLIWEYDKPQPIIT